MEFYWIVVYEVGYVFVSIVLEMDEVICVFVDMGYFEVGGF